MPRRPPKRWFDECVASVSVDPDVTDPNAVCAWNWYYHMSESRRRQILRGETFDPDTDIMEDTFAFDPKLKRRRRINPKKKYTKRQVSKASELVFEHLRKLYQMYEVYGKYLRDTGIEPAYVYTPIFRAQGKIEDAIRYIREVIGALS